MEYILYNPQSNNGNCLKDVKDFEKSLNGEVKIIDATTISYVDFLSPLSSCDKVYLIGGDGTIFRLINELDGKVPQVPIYYHPAGNGNDFANDINYKEQTKLDPILLNDYIDNLPKVTVNGMTKRFINGVGFGIDGMCCQVGDDLKAKGAKKINYTSIAIKQLLYKFKSKNAIVTVDGKTYNHKNVWIAPSMKGRFYGGGMIVAPMQNRKSDDKKLSLVLFCGKFRIPTLIIFPSIFKGEHIKHKKNVAIYHGDEITVTFNSPTALQIDGETVRNVTTYTVKIKKE